MARARVEAISFCGEAIRLPGGFLLESDDY